jgi:P27 family predicted phage terminase small subunit
MAVGRKPKPTHLKLVQGTMRKSRRNNREPKPAPGLPTCPQHLSEVARTEWRRIAPLLAEIGLLTAIDRAALAAYCQAYGRWVEAERMIAEHGTLMRSPSGQPVPSPLLRIAHTAMRQMQSILVEFGMSPSARSRIAAGEPAQPRDPFDDLLSS